MEVLKLFCSVRYEDYELYMRLLGEVPVSGLGFRV